MKLAGLVACGGKSSRMGTDKSLLIYHGETQRIHVRNLLLKFCDNVWYSLNNQQDDACSFKIFDNKIYEGMGPATGLLSAFTELPGSNIIFIGCDYPFLTISELERFIKESKPGRISCFYNEEGFYEPLLCIIPYSCRASLVQHLLIHGSLQKAFIDLDAFRYIPEDGKCAMSVDEADTYKAILCGLGKRNLQ